MITAIILTFNEEIHIHRCLKSIYPYVDNIYIVDSFSTDNTTQIAECFYPKVKILQNKWKNHSDQFNWALSKIENISQWILRIDADEILSISDGFNLNFELINNQNIDGYFLKREIIFQGDLVKYGAGKNLHSLRLFRTGKGFSQQRLMDEHIYVSGKTSILPIKIIDKNLKTLTWWTEKHNKYATNEAIELLNIKYNFINQPTANLSARNSLRVRLYSKLPLKLRAAAYFIYQYFIQLGFMDSKSGREFHFLQSFWYRYLVDSKIYEVQLEMEKTNCNITNAVEKVLGFRVD
jgi:glycosyltransferase involved in cell wall biosynthesis